MFTGIITDIGTIKNVHRNGDVEFDIKTVYNTENIDLGASICCSGVCLTVTKKTASSFFVLASQETLSKTTLQRWQTGHPVNLERALKMGDELGGHIVSGHVDGVATLKTTTPVDQSLSLKFQTTHSLSRFIAAKGSVTIDGVSLTVNDVDGLDFTVNIIPHTQQHTTLGQLKPDDLVNLEIDMLARYVSRLLEKEPTLAQHE